MRRTRRSSPARERRYLTGFMRLLDARSPNFYATARHRIAQLQHFTIRQKHQFSLFIEILLNKGQCQAISQKRIGTKDYRGLAQMYKTLSNPHHHHHHHITITNHHHHHEQLVGAYQSVGLVTQFCQTAVTFSSARNQKFKI